MMNLYAESMAWGAMISRELKRFFRQRSRWMGALITPVGFWLVLGLGMGDSFQSDQTIYGQGYREYFFPGILLMILLFTSIFSMVSLIEDRKEGMLQAGLVSPLSRGSLVLGKVFGCVAVSLVQGVLFLALAPVAGLKLGAVNLLSTALSMVPVAIMLSLMGFFFAWRVRSVQGFHVIMNVVFFPIWLLSGAAFPAEGASSAVFAWIIRLNPLAYGLDLMRASLYLGRAAPGEIGRTSVAMALAIVLGASAILMAGCVAQVRRNQSYL